MLAKTLDSDRTSESDLPRAFGAYVLVREIGRGSMGVVYEAHDEELGRSVALKAILAGRFAAPEDVERFKAEARAAARLEHAGIARVHEVGRCEGQHYFTMELVHGRSLAEELEGGPIDPRRAARIAAEAADAIHYAHQQGVVHRDLKPRNILLDAEGHPRITDFGLAKTLDSDASLTASGEALGTPAYMAPEQAAGEADAVGPAADVYGIGAVLYALLSGRPLFLSPTALGTLQQVQEREPIPLRVLNPAIPRDVETICHACLHKLPARRPASAAALADDLRRFLEGKAIVARPVGRLERAWMRARRRPVVTALSTALVLLALIAGGAIAWQWRHSVETAAELVRADRERAAARVGALVEASYESFPFLAARIESEGAEIVAQLDRLGRDRDATPKHRLRARLALATLEPELLEGIPGELVALDHDPGELALSTNALRAARAHVAEDAWRAFMNAAESQLAGAAADRRSAQALLCALDPEGAWSSECDALARALAEADPYLLPAWERALAPYPEPLLEALSAIALEDGEERGLQAARILARRPFDAPAVCAALLPRVDRRRMNALLPSVLEAPEVSAPVLHAALDEISEPQWPRVDVPDGELDDQAVSLIEEGGGLVGDDHALAPELSVDDFLYLADALRPAGYRPTRARPWLRDGELCCAVVWARDGAEWELAFDVGEHELDGLQEEARESELHPVDLASWEIAGEARYVALFGPLSAEARGATFLTGELDAASEFDAALQGGVLRLGQAGFRPDGIHVCSSPGGRRHLSSTWLRMERVHEFFFPPALTPEVLARQPFPDLCQMDVAPWQDVQGRARYAAIWYPDAHHESREVAATTYTELRESCAALSRQGFRPRALGVHEGTWIRSVWQRPVLPAQARLDSSRTRARAALALARMGEMEDVWPQLGTLADRDLRSRWIVESGPLGVDPELLVQQLERTPDDETRRALVLALGDCTWPESRIAERDATIARLLEMLRDEADPGLHSACAWTLRALEAERSTAIEAPPDARWRIAGNGLTMIAIPEPVEFTMGSPGTEVAREPAELLHRRLIPRAFELSATELGFRQLAPFFEAVPAFSPGMSGDPDTPPVTLSWFQAVAYCRWLSEQEGVPEEEMCYPPLDQIRPGMTEPLDALERAGYRLPTEAEWEYCARAGALTSYSFGDDTTLLPYFAHCRANTLGTPGPVARFRPNELGFFDMHGNVMEWCQDSQGQYPVHMDGRTVVDLPAPDWIELPERKIVRGGTFDVLPSVMRSAERKRTGPNSYPRGTGFRIARTLR